MLERSKVRAQGSHSQAHTTTGAVSGKASTLNTATLLYTFLMHRRASMIDGEQVKGPREAWVLPMSHLFTLAFTPHLS